MVIHVYITPVRRITCPGTTRLPNRMSSDHGNVVENCSKLLVQDTFAFLLAKPLSRDTFKASGLPNK